MSSSADSRSRAEQSLSHQPLADAPRIVDTVREPLLVVGHDRRVKQVIPTFYKAFATDREATIGEWVFSLGGRQFDRCALRGALPGLLEEGPSFEEGKIDRIFGGLGRRIL